MAEGLDVLTMKRFSSGKFSILLVPENKGASFSFKVSGWVLRIILIAGVALAFFFVVMLFSWGTLYRKASIYDKLAEETRLCCRNTIASSSCKSGSSTSSS